jgi:hypothetical protein
MPVILSTSSPAKSPAFTGQHHGAHAGIFLEPRAGFRDGFEHSRIKRVHFIGPIEPDVSDAVRHRQVDAIIHDCLLTLARVH